MRTHPADTPDRTPRRAWYHEVTLGQWKALSAAWIGYLLDGFDFVLITLVLTEIAHDFHLDTATAASLVSAAFITRWLGGALLGALGDRHGRRTAMVVSILLYSLGTFACGFAWDYTSLFAARLVIGLGMAGEYSSSVTYVLESWPVRLRNRASGFLISGYAGGTVLAGQLYAWVVPTGGWRWMFWIGVLPVLVAVWMRRSLPESGDWQAEIGDASKGGTGGAVPEHPHPFRLLFARGPRRPVNAALTAVAFAALFCVFTPLGAGFVPWSATVAALCLVAFAVQLGGRHGWLRYVALMVTVFCAFLYSWPVQSLLPTYLKSELGYTPAQVGEVVFFAGFGAMVGCWLAGFTGDLLGTRRAYALTLVASLAFVFPVFAVRGSLVGLGVLLFVLLALGQGISGILPKYIAGHFPTATRAASLGFVYNVGALGGAVAPVLGAQLARGMPLGRALAVLTFGLTLLVVVLVGGDVPRRLGRLVERQETGDHLVPGPGRGPEQGGARRAGASEADGGEASAGAA
ncbi:sialate:H+ symport family MFS transporter [Streptomyces sp. NPDC093097]|uniref:sialate:H+ symport family MFS transporter n=1 Tax=Streptomyces sp. NPDC093097 TaxID=3366027 RepID=UPI00381DF359